MSLTKYLSAVILLLASYSLASYVAVAQTETTTPVATPPVTTTANSEASAEPEPAVSTSAEQPFEDYEASEQISEDLSVAFPVDI
ncbi:hypothetical protein R0135_14845 [Congregibacter variabilis]|uniref:Uncharacterized protein n=1 Tax=Congregibacter variabilis TaxID=3081200 RepID=A0ABZ0I4N0_9GAMM|nr:hypothetical protein R0135_14845 [Congregibacter sp. IMCC43200]